MQVNILFPPNYKLHNEERHMGITISESFYLLIEEDYVVDLHKLMLAIPEPTFLQLFKYAITIWGNSTSGKRKANDNAMYKSWYPNNGTTKLWHHLQHCANYARYMGQYFYRIILQDVTLIFINRMRAFNEEYKQFYAWPVVDQYSTHLKIYFDLVHAN